MAAQIVKHWIDPNHEKVISVAALVGARVYPITFPQTATRPLVIYQRTSNVPQYSHDGPANVTESRFQISAFSKTYDQAHQVAAEIRGAFADWEAEQANVSGIVIGAAFLENEIDLFNPQDVEFQSDYHVLCDYVFQHEEA